MKLKPACSWCKDHDQFEDNMLMKILVTSFIKLCEYVYSSPLGKKISSVTINGETNNLMSILQEALTFEDKYIMKTSQSIGSLGDPLKGIKAEPQEPVAGCSTSEDVDNKSIENAELDTENDETSTAAIVNEVKHVQSPDKPRTREVNVQKIYTETEKIKTQSVPKTVVFMKRASKNRLNKKNKLKSPGKKSLLKIAKSRRKKLHRPNITKRETSDFFPVVTLSSENNLDSEQSKRIKLDLPPPELKPPSFCRCGKSGKYNQLTCLGQRCPCYSMKLPCIGCKCKGCRNPKKGPQNSGQDHFSSALLRSGVRNHSDSLYVM